MGSSDGDGKRMAMDWGGEMMASSSDLFIGRRMAAAMPVMGRQVTLEALRVEEWPNCGRLIGDEVDGV